MNNLNSYLKKYGIRLGVVVVLVALIIGLVADRSQGKASALENASTSIALPAKKGSTGFIGWLEGIYGYMFRYDELKAENEELKTEIAVLEGRLRDAKQTETENEELRSLLGLRDKHSDFEFESAKIIDRGSSNWSSTLTIGKGEESGVEVGDCVIDSCYNLVGQVTEIGTGWATVRTVIDTDMRVGVLVGDGGNAAMIVGDFALMRKGQTKLSYLTEEAQVFAGDVLLTSGKGGSFPRGIVIGTVDEIKSEASGQVEYATVVPKADTDALTQVFVIKDFEVID